MSEVTLKKDGKGSSYIISKKRCGITQCLYMSVEDLQQLQELLNDKLDEIRAQELAGI